MPIKYVPYFPNTIEGQAILDNFTRSRRVLRYRDNTRVHDRIRRGLPLYEVEKIEEVKVPSPLAWEGQGGGGNLLIRGECLSACAYLKDQGITVDLVYIDPPFASGADYAKKVYLRRNPLLAEKIKKAEEAMDLDELRAFEEKMYGDIWNKEDYLNWMYENLMAIKSVMSDTASIYVHLDWHIGHYVKVLMDEVFGDNAFLNEIVWKRFNFHADAQRFGTVHENIFYYCNDPENYVFNLQYIPFKDSYIKSHFSNTDENGRAFRLDNPTAPAHGKQGKTLQFGEKELAPPAGAMWRFKQENIDKFMADGKIVFTASGMPAVKRYLDELEGTAVHSIWTDVFPINSQADERGDYATQKPETLLERIIKTSSNEGMVVADFFGGSGVTAAVANRLGRRFVHTDVGINSIQTTRDRLLAAKADFTILDVKDGVSLFRNPVQTMDKLKSLITGLRNEDALDSFWEGAIADSKLGMVPVYVPNLLDHSSRVLDIPLMNCILNEAMPDLPDETRQVVVYYIDIDDEAAVRAFITENNPTETIVELRDLKELLSEVVADDVAEFDVSHTGNTWTISFSTFTSDRLIQKIDEYNQKRALNGTKKKLLDADEEAIDENGDNENGEETKQKNKYKPIVISENGLELIELISLDCTNSEGIWSSDYEIKIDKNGYVICNGEKSKTFWNALVSCQCQPLRMKIRNIAGDETIVSLGKS